DFARELVGADTQLAGSELDLGEGAEPAVVGAPAFLEGEREGGARLALSGDLGAELVAAVAQGEGAVERVVDLGREAGRARREIGVHRGEAQGGGFGGRALLAQLGRADARL